MNHWFNDWTSYIVAAVGGPGHLRFVLQPLVAIALGIRDGRLDAKAGVTPFLWGLAFEPATRGTAWRSALRSLWKPLAIATVLDGVLQVLIRQRLRPAEAVLTGCLLVGLPYVIVRALANRLATRVHRGWRARDEPPEAPSSGPHAA
jgi:hypothetical protein